MHGELNADVGIYRHAHNEFLQALATEGVIGGTALMLMYLALLMFFLRAMRGNGQAQPFALAGVLLVLTFFYYGLTQVLFAHHVGSAFYALAVSMLAGICLPAGWPRST